MTDNNETSGGAWSGPLPASAPAGSSKARLPADAVLQDELDVPGVSSRARLEVTVQPALNVALWQNHVPVLSELSFVNTTGASLADIIIELTSEPPILQPRSWRLQHSTPNQIHPLADLDVRVNGALLDGLTEAVRGSVRLSAIVAGDVVAEVARDIRVLTRNEWGGTSSIPDILAAFVQPNDPAVARIAHQASNLLRDAGKPDGLEGYQGSKTRVWEQAQAIWSAICRLDIRYITPPPSFVEGGQRIRSPRQITEERLATCLDLAVLSAACLEYVGLRPLVVLQREHAFAGLWLAKGDFGSSTVDDAPGLRTRLKLDDLLLFETTLVTQQHKPSFRQTCAVGADHIVPERDADFEGLVDIHRARQRRILPLATLVSGDDGLALPDSEQAFPPPMEDAPVLREDMASDEGPAPTTPEGRLERWRKRLLDLSGRNRLLNLSSAGRKTLFVDCPDPAALEDLLAAMRGQTRPSPLRLRPWPDLMTGADPRSASISRNRLQEDASLAYAREALAKRELLVTRDDADLQKSLTEIYRKARADQQEGGSHTLFLTIGSLLWRQKEKATPYRAPLILVPVMLERPSVKSGFLLRAHDDETRLNATLLEMLRQDFSIRFPVLEGDRLPEDEAGFDVARIFDIFRSKLRDIPGWEVRDEVALTTLSFAKFLMWKDLADRSEALRSNDIARRLMDGPGAANSPEPRETCSETLAGGLDEELGSAEMVCPLEADSSQLRAVKLAASGKSFVLIGPPGTGKSQTIANIIANTMAQGRTVLFVAEKRAALEVVRRRMRQVGLADFCLDLFSSKANKSAVLAQLDRAQQSHTTVNAELWGQATAAITVLRAELNGYVQELHRPGRNGWTPFRAIGAVLRAEHGGVPEVPLSWPDPDQHDAGGWQRLVEVTEEARAILERVGPIAQSPTLSGIRRADWSPVWQTGLLEAARTCMVRLAAVAGTAIQARSALGLQGNAASRTVLAALSDLAGELLDPVVAQSAWALAETAETTREAVRVAQAQVRRHGELRTALTGSWRPEVMQLPLAEIRTAWRTAATQWALARNVGQRAVRKRLGPEALSTVPDDCGPDLERLTEMQEIAHTLAATPLGTALGGGWRGLDTDFGQLERGEAWAKRLRASMVAGSGGPDALQPLRDRIRRIVGDPDVLGAAGVALGHYRDTWRAAETALAKLEAMSGGEIAELVRPERLDWLIALAEHLSGWLKSSRLIQDWCAWRGVHQQASELGLGALMQALETGLLAPADAVRALEGNYARWWVRQAVHLSPRLRGFVAARHETRIERFRALDAHMLKLASDLARARLSQAIPGAAQRQHDPEYAVLTRELAKKQRHLPLRQLALRMPQAMRRLTPCLMMSPLSAAQYLPADAEPFDLVVFDEASQIPTWDAIGAVGRGRQVVIVGDPKQLPPTSFFERRTGDGDDEGVEVETHDLDSILDECLGASIPVSELTWHYRSRHESLIAFSNRAYYGSRLVTFPSPATRDQAVSFRYVAGGVYARAAARTNEVEAKAVVAEALTVLRARDRRSLGIVTFNAEQQSLIEDLLDRARRDDPSLEAAFSDDAPEPVLVKSLEGIQGEERDVMLFSLTYGPDQTGRISLNFGPLNLSGGERRLNVAITRARERLTVFGSLRPDQIDLSRTNAIGVAHLKQFLSFAEHGPSAFKTEATGPLGDYESPFETQVAERLRWKGWTAHPQIGVSGFRVDLGVVDPDAPGSFLAGVECDGATYHRGATARDRDRLRQAVLEGLGWRILRIWSTDWWTNAARETDRLHLALEAALVQAREKRALRDVEAAQVVAVADLEPEIELTVPVAASPDAEPGARESAEFYEDSYQARLSEIVLDVVIRLGPVREDRLVQHIARLHGFQRAGRDIRDRVISVLPPESPRTQDTSGSFVWPPGSDPTAWDRFRAPPSGEACDPADVALQELVALAKTFTVKGWPLEAALTGMRDACGLKRLGETSRRRCLQAIQQARVQPEAQ